MAQKFEPKLGGKRRRRKNRRRSRQRQQQQNQIKNQNNNNNKEDCCYSELSELFDSGGGLQRSRHYEDIYVTKFGHAIDRVGKLFSYTFWRTQTNSDVFWSIQGIIL